MSITTFLSSLPPERKTLLSQLHKVIMQEDKSVKASIEPMMGKEMIVYKAPGTFKYGLSSMKNYMSLHAMPIYGAAALYKKYQQLLPKASFQKGCINFKNEEEMPPEIVKLLIRECAPFDLLKLKEAYASKKAK